MDRKTGLKKRFAV